MLSGMSRRPTLLVLSGLLLSSQTACSLLDSDYEGQVQLLFDVQDPDNTYESIDLFDPNENQDFADNKDRISTGTVESIEFRFRSIAAANVAQLVLGSARLRPNGDESTPWIEGVSAWEGVQVLPDNTFLVRVPGDKQAQLTELIFEDAGEVPPLEIEINGQADQGPVDFEIEATLNLVFTAGL